MPSHEAIAWICLVHLLVFMTVLLIKKENRAANRMLALFMAGLAYGHLNHLLIMTHTAWKVFYLNELVFVIPFLMGPAFLQYTAYMTGIQINWRQNSWMHFLPALAIIPYYMSFFFDQPHELRQFYEISLYQQPVSNSLLLVMLTVQQLFYICWSRQLLTRYHRRIRQDTHYRQLRLRWLEAFIWLWLFLCVVVGPALIILSDADITVLYVLTPVITTILYFFLFVKAVGSGGHRQEQKFIRMLERRKIGQELYEGLGQSISRITLLSETAKQETAIAASELEEISGHAHKLRKRLRLLIQKLNRSG